MNDLAFGKAMGTSTGGVVPYSSDYKTINNNEYMTRHDFHSYVDGIYLGYKWQCVEFARRWLYVNKGYIFNNVAMAYEIFELTSVRDLATNTELPLYAFKNGATRPCLCNESRYLRIITTITVDLFISALFYWNVFK